MMWYNILLFDVIQKSIFSPSFRLILFLTTPSCLTWKKERKSTFKEKKDKKDSSSFILFPLHFLLSLYLFLLWGVISTRYKKKGGKFQLDTKKRFLHYMESPASHNVTIQLTDTVGWGGLVFFWLFQRLRQSWKGETDDEEEEEEEEERERQRRMEKARTLTSERTNERRKNDNNVGAFKFPTYEADQAGFPISPFSRDIFFVSLVCVCVSNVV